MSVSADAPRSRSAVAPVHLLELDLAVSGKLHAPGGPDPSCAQGSCPQGRVQVLVRQHKHPIGWVHATVATPDPVELYETLARAARRDLSVPDGPPRAPVPRTTTERTPGRLPMVSVIVCTRDRTEMLSACLDSLLRIDYPRLEIVLVDNNAPSVDTTEQLVRTGYGDRIRYLREPVPGLSWARNRGLAAARGEICAFTDDDVIVDSTWISALAEAFTTDTRVACVTGLVVPAELDTEAQLSLEAYGGPGRGFVPLSWSLGGTGGDPLVQFSAGRFGCGANMAFRTDVLRGLHGFDPAIGAGSRARGGEDLLAFQQVLSSGHTIVYQPDAVVWHRHRRTMDALARQVSGFGIGFGAYLTAAVMHQPRLLLVLMRRLPQGVWRWHRAGRVRERTASPGDLARFRSLKRLERRGLALGPFCYLVSVGEQRRARQARDRQEHAERRRAVRAGGLD